MTQCIGHIPSEVEYLMTTDKALSVANSFLSKAISDYYLVANEMKYLESKYKDRSFWNTRKLTTLKKKRNTRISDFDFHIKAENHVVNAKALVPDVYSSIANGHEITRYSAEEYINCQINVESQSCANQCEELMKRINSLKENIAYWLMVTAVLERIAVSVPWIRGPLYISTAFDLNIKHLLFDELFMLQVSSSLEKILKHWIGWIKMDHYYIKKFNLFLEVLTESIITHEISKCVEKFFLPYCSKIKFSVFMDPIDLSDISAMYDFSLDYCGINSTDSQDSTKNFLIPLESVLDSVYE